MNKKEFIEELKKLGINIDNSILEKLDKYYNMLVDENKHINLTRITDINDVFLKHFYDSLTIVKSIDLNNETSLCDIGTGAGFPGLVLKIVFPNLKTVLVDSLNKRVLFLKKVIKSLELSDIEAVHGRAEEYSKNNRDKFDIVVSRALARSEVLIELSIPLLKVKGHAVFMKANCEDEIVSLEKILPKYNSMIYSINRFELPFEKSTRTLINIIKKSKTPLKYPRTIDKIKKSNLV